MIVTTTDGAYCAGREEKSAHGVKPGYTAEQASADAKGRNAAAEALGIKTRYESREA